MCKHPFGPLHKMLAISFKHIAFKYDSVLFNVLELIKKCVGKTYNRQTKIFKADIATFYPSVKMEQVYKTVHEVIDKDRLKFISEKSAWITLIKLAHWKLEFNFEDKLLAQEDGLPIGSSSALVFAILTLHHHLKKKYEEILKCINAEYLGIYFDDLIGIANMENNG